MRVTIHHILTGAAAEAGGVRIDVDGDAIILLAQGLSVDDQAEILGELLHPDDTIEYAEVVIPQPRPVILPTRAAG